MSLLNMAQKYIFFGLEFDFDNIAFTIGNFSVYWYGIIIAVGFGLALIYGMKNAKRFQIDVDRMIDVIIVGLLGAIICARGYYLLFDGVPLSNYATFGDKMGYIFGIHNGGIAIYGGVIGAFVFGGLTAWLRKIKVLDMFDLAALGFLIGQSVGRWGNFINQEVYGMPTGSEWFGIGGDRIGSQLVHPLFLYESLWCLTIFLVLNKISKKRAFSGQIFSLYIILYSFGRFWFEGMRNTDFILMFGKLSISQLVAVALVVTGIALYILLNNRTKIREDDYESQFGSMYDDQTVLDAGYALLGCQWDDSDEVITAAYEALKAKYTALIPETEDEEPLSDKEAKKRAKAEQAKVEKMLRSDAPTVDDEGKVEISDEELALRAKLKLDEINEAYDYIMNNRKLCAEEAALFAEHNEASEGEAEEEQNDN